MRILVALGGNALLRRGEPADTLAEQRNIDLAARGLAEIASEHELVLTHGIGAQSEGMVGFMLDLALHNVLPDREVVTVITEVVVDSPDLAASPEPRAIVELRSLRTLIDAGALVICAGGGGVPVAVGSDGMLHGVETVVDKDLTAALLARRLAADLFVMLTDVDGVKSESMGSKAEAARRFVEATGGRAAIGALTDAVAIARGRAGMQIAPSA